MVKQIIICDKCKKEIVETNRIKSLDFCDKCIEPIINWIGGYIGEGKAPEQKQEKNQNEEQPNPHKSRKYKIDWNKACALKLAGWGNKEIAEELGCTNEYIGSLIYKRIAEYKKERGMK